MCLDLAEVSVTSDTSMQIRHRCVKTGYQRRLTAEEGAALLVCLAAAAADEERFLPELGMR